MKRDFLVARSANLGGAILLTLVLAGCASSYEPPQLAHTYVTNTQDYHTLSGLRIQYAMNGMNVFNATLGAAVATKEGFEYYIDGRLIASHSEMRNTDTLVQIPPGEHQFTVIQKIQGVATLGARMIGGRFEATFSLSPGEIAQISTSSGHCNIENVDDLEIIHLSGTFGEKN